MLRISRCLLSGDSGGKVAECQPITFTKHNGQSGKRIFPIMPKRLEISAADYLPERHSLSVLRDASKKCKGCDLWVKGTQTVFGEGASHARVLFVGEQPGDKEDFSGKPFVGPAGALLDKALIEAGIDRKEVYATNAVKHCKW